MIHVYKEIRRTTTDRIKSMLTKHGIFISGGNEIYEKILSYGEKESIITNDITIMAVEIYIHSYTIDMSVEAIMDIIANECCFSHFEELW